MYEENYFSIFHSNHKCQLEGNDLGNKRLKMPFLIIGCKKGYTYTLSWLPTSKILQNYEMVLKIIINKFNF